MSSDSTGHVDTETHGTDLGDDPTLWGWHHTFGKGIRVAGWICAIVIALLTIGNQKGHVETLWLLAVSFTMFAVLIHDIGRRRKSWR